MRTFVIGDIHGGYLALIQVLIRAGFDYQKDRLICLGDTCDGWPQVKEVLDELLKIKNLIYLLGNHDEWTLNFYTGKMKLPSYLSKKNIDEQTVHFSPNDRNEFRGWYNQGGKATLESLGSSCDQKYVDFLSNAKPYHYEDGMMFSHAGFDITEEKLEEQNLYYLIWDRQLIEEAYAFYLEEQYPDRPKRAFQSQWVSMFFHSLKEVYVGHTPTIKFNRGFLTPQKWNKVWNMDTGATYIGPLSMMNIETKEIFQSDPVMYLYPDHPGRNGISLNQM